MRHLPVRANEQGDEGFSLIELLVVIIIIGILAAIAVPVFLNQRKKAYDAQAKVDLKNAATAEEAWITGHASYTSLLSDLATEGFKATANTSLSVVSVRSNGGSSDNAASFCVKDVPSSGLTWYLDSAGGVGVTTAACT